MTEPSTLGVVAGNGFYPRTLIEGARKQNPQIRIIAIAFIDETLPDIEELADEVEWFRVGQVTKPFEFFKKHHVKEAVMVGQLAPKNLFNLRPDLRALFLLAKLKHRNAETIFGIVAEEAERNGIKVLPATVYMDDNMPKQGHIAGPKPKDRQLEDAQYGMEIAKEVSRLDIGQSVVVRHGTVLAVEGFEGTNECIRRGGMLGRGKEITLVKVSKPNHDMRFDVPVVGVQTIQTCHEAGVNQIVIEAGKTILLQKDEVIELCRKFKISLHAL
jgi:DUF1009 family protein